MDVIDREIAVYEAMRLDLEKNHWGKWVVLHNGKLAGTYASFEGAADDAMQRFSRGSYLIREVGEGPITLPALALYT